MYMYAIILEHRARLPPLLADTGSWCYAHNFLNNFLIKFAVRRSYAINTILQTIMLC